MRDVEVGGDLSALKLRLSFLSRDDAPARQFTRGIERNNLYIARDLFFLESYTAQVNQSLMFLWASSIGHCLQQ